LDLVQGKIFPERWQRDVLVDQCQIVQMAMKKTLIGQDGNTMGASFVVTGCNRQRIEFFRYYSGGRGSAFNLSDKPEGRHFERQPEIPIMPVAMGSFFPIFCVI
jgi:phage protein U